MNLVGKIFVVLIFVMSLVFMAFAMAVYATHRNWREEVTRPRERSAAGKELGLQYQLDERQGGKQELEESVGDGQQATWPREERQATGADQAGERIGRQGEGAPGVAGGLRQARRRIPARPSPP